MYLRLLAAVVGVSVFTGAAQAAVIYDWNDGTEQGWVIQSGGGTVANVNNALSWETPAGFTQARGPGTAFRATIQSNPILSVEVTPSTAPGAGQSQQVALFVEGSTGTTSFNRTGTFVTMPTAGQTYVATLDTTGLGINPSAGYLNIRFISNTGGGFDPGAFSFDNLTAAPVPEPAGLAAAAGAFGLLLNRRRR